MEGALHRYHEDHIAGKGACSSDFSEWNIDEKWSSQEWKSDEMLEARTERPVGGQPFTHHTHTSLSSMMIWTLTPPQNRTFR